MKTRHLSQVLAAMARPILALDISEVRERIYAVLSAQEADAAALKEPWEPVFDSLATIEIVCSVHDLIPDEVAAARIVRAGGYSNSSEAADDISKRIAAVCDLKPGVSSGGRKQLNIFNRQPSNE